MTDVANVDQAAYWTDRASAWVRKQPLFDALLAPALDLVLARAALARGDRVLDIGCGTGASLLAAAAQVGEEGHVTGLDVSQPMLDLAHARVAEAGLGQVACRLGDAQVFEFRPGEADHVISRFGVMFFNDPIAAFANIASGLKPGGRLTFVAWGELMHNPWFRDLADAAKAVVGTPPHVPDPRAPGPMAFSDPDDIREILTGGGFEQISVETASPKLTPTGSLDDVARFAAGEGPVNRILDEMGGTEADRDAIFQRLRSVLAQYATGGSILVPSRLNLVSARAAY